MKNGKLQPSFFNQLYQGSPVSAPCYLVSLLLPQFDGGETLDLGMLQLVGSRVHLGDRHGLRVLVLLAQLSQ